MPSLVSVQFIFYVPVFDLCHCCSVSQSSCWCLSLYFMLGGISPCPDRCLEARRQSSRHQLIQGSSPCVISYLRACNRATLELLLTCAQIIPAKWLNSAVNAGTVLVNKCMATQSSNLAKDSLNVFIHMKVLGIF